MLLALFLALHVLCLTTAQHTYIYDDEGDVRCEEQVDHLQSQLNQFQKEHQEQRQELEELKKAAGKSLKRDDADSICS